MERGSLNVMSASVSEVGSVGLKAYTVAGGQINFLVALWDGISGSLLSLIEADHLGRVRTGAASGVATEALSNPSASVMCVIGCGRQARTQIEAVAAVRKLSEVRVFCRQPEARVQFVDRIRQELNVNAIASETAERAVRGADIISTVTTSKNPVVLGEWLSPGAHVNAAGSNVATRREVDAEVVGRAAVVAVDSIEQAKIEAGDLLLAENEGKFHWSQAVELHTILSQDRPGRRATEEVTLFKSLGIAVEDVAVARHVYEKALVEGRGERSNFGEA